jgi:DNA-binding transcriptional LysR family regulator
MVDNMDRLGAMQAFVEVVERGSFSAAASRRGLSGAALSKSLAQLEQHLNARLLNRTTRRLSLTDAGRAYLERCRSILRDVEEAELAAAQVAVAPRGHLLVSAPSSFGAMYLAAAFNAFLRRYPEVTLELSLTDRFVDVVQEGFDLSIRIAELPDSSLVARRLAPCRRVYCASPDYLARYGRPQLPSELAGHRCLLNTNSPRPGVWEFHGEDGVETVAVAGPLSTDSGQILHAAVLDGQGIALLPTFYVGPDLRAGRLEAVLPAYCHPDIGIYALYASRRYLSAKTRALVEFLAERFAGVPEWERSEERASADR